MKKFNVYLEQIQKKYSNFYIFWNHEGILYEFEGLIPHSSDILKHLGYSINDSKIILQYCIYLKERKDLYDMLYFDINDYDKIKDLIEPNELLLFKEYDNDKCKWIFKRN